MGYFGDFRDYPTEFGQVGKRRRILARVDNDRKLRNGSIAVSVPVVPFVAATNVPHWLEGMFRLIALSEQGREVEAAQLLLSQSCELENQVISTAG